MLSANGNQQNLTHLVTEEEMYLAAEDTSETREIPG